MICSAISTPHRRVKPQGTTWRGPSRLLSLYERCGAPMCPPHFFTAARGRRVAFGRVATFVLGYKSHSVAGLSTLAPSQSFSVLLTPPTPSFPPLSLLLRVSYCRKRVLPLDSWDKEVCKLKYNEQSSTWMPPTALCARSKTLALILGIYTDTTV